ncbi:MAG: RNA ligase, Rnl2 family [Bacteroidota bacterium]
MFKRYSSIENTYREEFLSRIKGHGFWREEYVVQEKAHGSNLSYWTNDGVNFRAGKRSGPLEEGEKFYNFAQILERITPKLQAIWTDLKRANESLEQLTVFGELIGGSYPHPEVARTKDAFKVQKGVFYTPDNLFYAFDILIDAQEFLDIETANQLFEKHGLLYAKTLFKGDLESCLAYSNTFDSTIPALLGLPAISPNICEGTVIRPSQVLRFNNGVRVILKNKNDKWSETIKRPKVQKEVEVPEQVAHLRQLILDYVTENRLNNVLSKIGEVTRQDFGKVLGMFSKDIVEDFRKDYAKEWEALDKKETKMITKSISKVTVPMVREVCL